VGNYEETSHLCTYLTGSMVENHWKGKGKPVDIYYLKGVVEAIFNAAGVPVSFSQGANTNGLDLAIIGSVNDTKLVELGRVSGKTTHKFDIKQPVFYADFNWDELVNLSLKKKISYREIPKFPAVERDLAIVVSKDLKYEAIKNQLDKLRLNKLQHIQLFDVFESEKLGAGKKSLAVNFTFLDEEKTLTDKEIDTWMNKIMTTLEKELGAEIRK
jgi:phenylalanyl-tRNA synthetase beta chain